MANALCRVNGSGEFRRATEVAHKMLISKTTRTFGDSFSLLNCRRLPARLNSTEVAVLLGVQDHDVPVLIGAKLLAPLGKPATNAPKYFAAVEIVERAQNSEWLTEATKVLAKYWRRKNQRKLLSAHSFE